MKVKKLLFFLFATILFASCSNDSQEAVTAGKTYKVTFNVSNFALDQKPLKVDNEGQITNYSIEYAIYKYGGEFVKSGLIESSSFDQNSVKIEEEILAGTYWIAIVAANKFNNEGPVLSNLSNINTDYCNGNFRIDRGHDNETVYYEKLAFTVGDNVVALVNDVVLKPMWTFLYVNVLDAATCHLPEGTAYVQCTTTPFYYGFGLKDGIATKKYDKSPGVGSGLPMTVGAFRGLHGLMEAIPVTATKDATVKFVCFSTNGSVLSEKVIYTGDIENGKYITFKGTLGNSTSNASFNVSLGDLIDGGIIPFE